MSAQELSALKEQHAKLFQPICEGAFGSDSEGDSSDTEVTSQSNLRSAQLVLSRSAQAQPLTATRRNHTSRLRRTSLPRGHGQKQQRGVVPAGPGTTSLTSDTSRGALRWCRASRTSSSMREATKTNPASSGSTATSTEASEGPDTGPRAVQRLRPHVLTNLLTY